MSLVNVRACDVAVTTRATMKTTSIARHRGKISFASLTTRRRAVTTRATVRGDENARGGAHAMRARGSIEDATVTPDFEHVLATMEEMHEAELRRVRDKYESEMATFKRFANDREGETAQAVFGRDATHFGGE